MFILPTAPLIIRTSIFTDIFLPLAFAEYLEDIKRFPLLCMVKDSQITLSDFHITDLTFTGIAENVVLIM
ncbi:hypothetical protein [Pseudomonas sp. 25 E 4]|nr:hypothetical protein [Pseudomonas sp. 25 E 4]